MDTHTKSKFARTSYFLAPNLTLINNGCSAQEQYILRDPDQGMEHFLDEGDYRLLVFLLKPRQYNEITSYYNSMLPHEVMSPDRIECSLDEYLERFLNRRLIRSGRGKFPREDETMPIHVPFGMIEEEGKRRVHAFPKTVAFCPTNRCNLACRHCSQRSGTGWRREDELTLEEITDLFAQLERYGIHHMRITGGEPTVRRDFFEILEEAARRRFALYLFTNGTLLNENNVRSIARVRETKKGNFLVHLSLDGGTRESHEWLRRVPGCFDRLRDGMKLLQEHDIPFYCEMNLNKHNISTLEQAVQLLIEHGAGSISMHTTTCSGRAAVYDDFFISVQELRKAKIEVNRLRKKYKGMLGIRLNSYNFPLIVIGKRYLDPQDKYDRMLLAPIDGNSVTENLLDPHIKSRCNAGVGQFTIGADGKIYPCPNCFGVPEFEAGDIREHDLLHIWRKGNWGIFRSLWMVEQLHLCKKCKWLEMCRLGYVCRPPVYTATGDFFGPPPACLLAYKDLGFKKSDVLAYLRSAIDRVPENRNSYLRFLYRRIQRT